MVKKSDWKTLEMPGQTTEFVINRELKDNEKEYIKEGHKPQEMEDKWFMYYEDNKLFIHRSWTGYCIYIIDCSRSPELYVTASRNPEQYKETDIEKDKIQVNILINQLIRRNEENAKEMDLSKENKMWGVCLDNQSIQEGLFQAVIQYKIKENGEAVIILPETAYKPDIKYIKELPVPPRYIYGEQVSPRNHPDITGIIYSINWHFKSSCCFYKIKVNGKVKSKRYYDNDLNPASLPSTNT